MVPGTRTMHVLWVVCCHLVLLTLHVMAYPTGKFGESESLSYSPSYDFIDEYLRHNDEELTPSDSELGDLIWDLLYRPNAQTLPWKRNTEGMGRQQSWDIDNGRHHKRQQGWYTDYGKRQQGWHSDYGKRQQGWHSDYGKRQQGWHSDYGKRQQGWHSDYGKRQQGWYIDYGKRQQGWPSDWNAGYIARNEDSVSPRDVSLTGIYKTLSRGWRPSYRKRQQGWHVDYGKRSMNVDDVTWYDRPLEHYESLGRNLDLPPYTPTFATEDEPNANVQAESSGYEDLEQEIRRRQLRLDPEQDGLYELKH
ncbi:uncharacterized protein [Haliotis asinina]|uniref:uncharacterized protein n=1 Tax=Haliotis asinina TaxID=109174 RepID=UPI0035325583